MRIAVTGASGFLGRALIDSLTGDGHEVIRVVRPATAGTASGPIARWDIDAGTIDAAALEGLDAVVNLAGAGIGDKRWTDERKREIAESRTKGTTLLASCLAGLDRPPRVLISGSAVGYYGDRGDEVLTEASGPQEGDFLAGLCVDWERATAPAEAAGVRVTHIRTGIVLGPGGGALGKVLPLFKLGLGGRMGSGKQWWSWIDLADEIGAIRFLIDHDVAGPVNLVGPDPVTNAAFTKALGHAVHRPTVLAVPRFAPRILLGTEAADHILFSSQRAHPSVLEREGYQFHSPTIDAALASMLAL